MKKIIVLLGAPGSGKGTQGALLSEQLNIPHISTGDIFRKMASNEANDNAKLLNKYMQAGKLVPADLVNKIVKDFISLDECKNGCILDGYPRSLVQAKYFTENVDSEIIAIFFDVADEVIIKRIAGRYSCTSCGALYNQYFDQPKVAGVCDVCGSKEFGFRPDDNEKTAMARVEEYKKETLPVVKYYRKLGGLFIVDADAAKEKVTKEVALIAKRI